MMSSTIASGANSRAAVRASKSAVWWAAWCLGGAVGGEGGGEGGSGEDDPSLAASTAKIWCTDASARVMASSLQVHGGIGFTWEHDLHFFLKRGRANASMYGDARWHREQVAKRVLAPA